MRRHRGSAMALSLVAVILTGCGGASNTSGPAGGTTTRAPARPSSTANLFIITPVTGQVLPGGDIPLKVKLTGAKIVAATSTTLVPNQGHLHVILDNQLISMTAGTSTTLPDVAPGHHLLQVEFVANDHAPFDPRVIAAASFTVKG